MRQNVGIRVVAILWAATALPASAQNAAQPTAPEECNSWCRVVRTFSPPPPPAPAAAPAVPLPEPRRAARRAPAEAAHPDVTILVDRDAVNASLVKEIGSALEGVEKVRVLSAEKPIVADLLSRPQADAAIVTRYALDQTSAPDKLVSILKLFPQELHAVVGSAVATLEDLNGREVYVGPAGSDASNAILAFLDSRSIAVSPVHGSVEEGLQGVRDGRVAAALVIAPKPFAPLAALTTEDGLKLLALSHRTDDPTLLPGMLAAETYPGLLPAGGRIETVAFETALVAPRWRENSPRQRELSAFATALLERLPVLSGEGHHPKWRDLNAATEVAGLRRLKVAQEWVRAKLKERERVGTREGRRQVGEMR